MNMDPKSMLNALQARTSELSKAVDKTATGMLKIQKQLKTQVDSLAAILGPEVKLGTPRPGQEVAQKRGMGSNK